MKSIFFVLLMILGSSVALNAKSAAAVEYVCQYMPAPQLISGHQEVEPEMIRVCKPVKSIESVNFEQAKEYPEGELPKIGPVKEVFERIMFKGKIR